MKLAIVAAEFNRAVVDVMIDAAVDEATTMKWDADVVRVSGTYETPLPANALLATHDAVVVLGYIERGETLHGEVMGRVVHDALMRLSLRHAKPIGLGIIGPGATEEQAHLRKDAYARAAVRAAVHLHTTMRTLRSRDG